MLLHIYVFYIGETACMYVQMYNVFIFLGVGVNYFFTWWEFKLNNSINIF